MTREETIKLIGVIKMAYPNYDKFSDEKHIRSMVGVWADIFSGDDSSIVAMSLMQHINTSKWPPSIAEIRDIMTQIQRPDIIPPDEAWAAVSKLLYTEGEYCHIDICTLLPRPIAEAIEAVGYSQLYALHVAHARGYSNKAGLDRVAFIQAYEGKYEKEKLSAMLPQNLRQSVETAKGLYSDGSRKMLEDMDVRYADKRAYYELEDFSVLGSSDELIERQIYALGAGDDD